MREIDKDGLLLCNLQGDIFASSLEYTSSSSEIFMRRFMNSNLSKEFDQLAILNDSLTIKEAFETLVNEFGETSYGKIKYNEEVLFWIGYIYRYMAYTYDLSSKHIYKIIKPKELNELYYVYHTFDCAQAIDRILEDKNISYDYEKQNQAFLKLMRNKKYEKEVIIVPMNTEYAKQVFSNFKNDISLFENENEFKEHVYSKEEIDKYIENKENILLAILYNNEAVGEIRFKKIKEDSYELGIVLKDDKYKNKGLGSIAITKAIEFAKNEVEIKSIFVKILKTNERSIHVFINLSFEYVSEDDKFVYFSRQI